MNDTRILIVEDERIVALDLKSRLESEGYRVEGLAASGEDAVRKAAALEPDLVLMDIRLEGEMDGIDAAGRIHEQFGIPVVFLTAFASDETIERARRTEPYGYLVKPFEDRELHATIKVSLTRRQAELAVERSEERMRMALDAGRFAIWEWVKSPSPAAPPRARAIAAGATPENERYERFLAAIHPNDRPGLEDALMASLISGRAINGEYRWQADDDLRWIELHAKSVRTGRSETGRLVGLYRDVTDRRQREERLRQNAVVYESTAEGILILDSKRRVVSANPAFTSLTGFTLQDTIGRHPQSFLFTQAQPEAFFLDLASGPSGLWHGEIMISRKDTRQFPVWLTVSAVRDESATVSHIVFVFSDLTAVRQAEAQLRHLAQHDPLTSLPNRLLFDDRLEQTIEIARRENAAFAVLFVDLDNFKSINDTLGHGAGDELLKILAERIRLAIRRSDTAARLGGDEFVIIASMVDRPEDAAHLADKLLQTIGEPCEVAGESVVVSASIGISVYPDDFDTKQALLQAADNAMYSAKSAGRNRYGFYAADMGTRAAQRMATEQGLKRALAQQQFEVDYQPIVDLTSGEVDGFEALVRWRHPKSGLLLPDSFVHIAEECGVIEPLGRWVLGTACAEMVRWMKHWGRAVRIGVNVSTRQLQRHTFLRDVLVVLRDTGLSADLLVLEMTESALQSPAHGPLLRELRDLGLRIAIDDFGTGFSSLGTLKHWSIDGLKIDRTFVRDLPHDPNSAAIVDAIAAIGASLGLSLVAEGIETVDQLERLKSVGVTTGQGYLFGSPMSARSVADGFEVRGGGLYPKVTLQ